MELDLINFVIGLFGIKGASILVGATSITTAASLVLKGAEIVSGMTPNKTDDKVVGKAVKVTGAVLRVLALNPKK